MGTVHVELPVMLILPWQLQHSHTHSLDRATMEGDTGYCYPFHNSPEIGTQTQYPGLSSGGAGADRVKIPVSYLGPVATASL